MLEFFHILPIFTLNPKHKPNTTIWAKIMNELLTYIMTLATKLEVKDVVCITFFKNKLLDFTLLAHPSNKGFATYN
jgi:hypothetical protein